MTADSITTPQPPAEGTILMFTTDWCGYCRRLKTQLASEGIAAQEINIEQEEQYIPYVEQVNGGNRTVPTVVFPDGTAATNPSLGEVLKRLGR